MLPAGRNLLFYFHCTGLQVCADASGEYPEVPKQIWG